MNIRSKAQEEIMNGPLRRCAITRNRRPPELLLRFVVNPQGSLTEDLAGRLPGRGLYVTPNPKLITALLARHKMVKEEINALLTRLEQALIRRLLDGIGLSRRAGSCKVGLREVEELLKRGHRPLLLLATDAGSIREKVTSLMQSVDELTVVEILDREQLGTVWGDKLIALAAITNPGVAQRILNDATRWRSFTQIVEKVAKNQPLSQDQKDQPGIKPNQQEFHADKADLLLKANKLRQYQKRVPHDKKGILVTGVCKSNNVPEGH